MKSLMIRPCVIVPVFNHHATLHVLCEAIFQELQDDASRVFLIDDGSDLVTKNEMVRLLTIFPRLVLDVLPVNQGKGAAVIRGFELAAQHGFTHALQIDADYQHQPKDIQKFLDLAESHPEAIIAGQPIYDESIPKSRLYGRYITHIFVWLDTLSMAIGDSMCGYRLYPLKSTLALVRRQKIALRMAFDIDIIVRLFWQGVPVVNLPTPVTYPLDGISHFDVLRDNVRITVVHAKLFVFALFQMPRLFYFRYLRRKNPYEVVYKDES